MCEPKALPRVSAKIPAKCPKRWPGTQQRPNGSLYHVEHPCNNRNCLTCRYNRANAKILKAKDGLYRSAYWWQRELNPDDPGYHNTLRRLLARLNKWGLWYTSDEWLIGGKRVRYVFHEPIPGQSSQGVVVRTRRKTLKAIIRLIRSDESRAVRFCRESKTRPCWPKTTAERRRDRDRRTPDQKHRLVVASQHGPVKFQRIAMLSIGRPLKVCDAMTHDEVDTLYLRSNPCLPTDSKPSSCIAARSIRSGNDERAERRLERASWYDSGG